MADNLYFDYAAATPVDPVVLAAMMPYFSEQFYNPSAQYLAAKDVRQAVEAARASVAQIVGVRPAEVIFTAGGTEANNLAVQGVADCFPGTHLVMTALEHDSIQAPLRALAKKGWQLSEVTPREDGIVEPEAVLAAVKDDTVLISVMTANNEVGTIQPIREIAAGIAKLRQIRQENGNVLPLYLHTDACQAANYLDLHLHRLGADLMTLNGGKIYGPKQSGALIALTGTQFEPQIYGGGQELNRRSGTENVPAIVGFAKALERATEMRKTEGERLQQLQSLFFHEVQIKLPRAQINGSLKHRLPNNVHITLPGSDNERLLYALDEAGIQAAAGSACSASKEEASHVLKALGVSDENTRASLRFSMGRNTTEQAVHRAVETLAKLA
jgi:cysteine desulfurase